MLTNFGKMGTPKWLFLIGSRTDNYSIQNTEDNDGNLNLLAHDPNPGGNEIRNNDMEIVSTMAGETDGGEDEGTKSPSDKRQVGASSSSSRPGTSSKNDDSMKNSVTGLNKSILSRMWSDPNLMKKQAEQHLENEDGDNVGSAEDGGIGLPPINSRTGTPAANNNRGSR